MKSEAKIALGLFLLAVSFDWHTAYAERHIPDAVTCSRDDDCFRYDFDAPKYECEDGRCQCRKGFEYSSTSKKCESTGYIIMQEIPEVPCPSDEFCASKFGKLSSCSNNNKCQCADTETGKRQVVFFDGTCVVPLKIGERCDFDKECQAGFHRNAYCTEAHGDFGGAVCKCRDGESCESSAASVELNAVVALASLTLAFYR